MVSYRRRSNDGVSHTAFRGDMFDSSHMESVSFRSRSLDQLTSLHVGTANACATEQSSAVKCSSFEYRNDHRPRTLSSRPYIIYDGFHCCDVTCARTSRSDPAAHWSGVAVNPARGCLFRSRAVPAHRVADPFRKPTCRYLLHANDTFRRTITHTFTQPI